MPEKYGERWFYYLVPSVRSQGGSLYEKLTAKELEGKFIVSRSVMGRNGWFPMFAAVADPYSLILRTPEEDKTYTEVIEGSQVQKPHFDIDGPIELRQRLSEGIISAIQDYIEENIPKDIEPRFYLIDQSDERKASMHVIGAGITVENNEEAKRFMELIVQRMPQDLREYVDKRVYLSIQHFRMPGCHKAGTTRVKQMPESEDEFYDQLVTAVQEGDWKIFG